MKNPYAYNVIRITYWIPLSNNLIRYDLLDTLRYQISHFRQVKGLRKLRSIHVDKKFYKEVLSVYQDLGILGPNEKPKFLLFRGAKVKPVLKQ